MSSLPPTGSIGFKVTGLLESIKGLDNIMRQMPIVEKAVLNEAARFLVNDAKARVHVVSRDLQKSISIEPGVNPKVVIVSAKTRYARIENEREGSKNPSPKSKPPYGPHDYFTRAIKATELIFRSKIKVNFDSLFAKNKTR